MNLKKTPEGIVILEVTDFQGLNQILILMRGGKKVKYCK
jgi:hypothetical protein